MTSAWPSNIMELHTLIERPDTPSSPGVLTTAPAELNATSPVIPAATEIAPAAVRPKRVRAVVPPLTREQVEHALRESGGRVGGVGGAAARLGLKRTTLIAQMKRLPLN